MRCINLSEHTCTNFVPPIFTLNQPTKIIHPDFVYIPKTVTAMANKF